MTDIEKEVLLAEVSHKDIGKQVSFVCEVAAIKAEFRGVLAGIDRLQITLKGAEFRRVADSGWSPTAERNPEITVDEQTLITVYRSDG